MFKSKVQKLGLMQILPSADQRAVALVGRFESAVYASLYSPASAV